MPGKKTFVDGTTLTAADVNGYLMDQAVMRFASASARDTAIPSPTEGMVAYLDDVNWIMVYTGSGWVRTAGETPYFIGSATTSVSNATDTIIAVTTGTNRGSFTNSSGTITVPVTGIYSITATATFPSHATGVRYVTIFTNGGVANAPMQIAAVNGNTTIISTNCTIYLSAGNTVALRVYQNSGTTLSVPGVIQINQVGA